MNVYALWDRKGREYGQLVLGANDESVVRALKDGVPKGSTVEKYPEDFDIMRLGRFDSLTGELSGEERGFVVNVATVLGKHGEQAELRVEVTEKGKAARG